jgi:hypothetical protein
LKIEASVFQKWETHPQKKRGLTFVEKWGFGVSQTVNTPLKEKGLNIH